MSWGSGPPIKMGGPFFLKSCSINKTTSFLSLLPNEKQDLNANYQSDNYIIILRCRDFRQSYSVPLLQKA